MVRKRSRKYESDDNDSDSDDDFEPEQVSTQPATKKYSLRARKSTPVKSALDYLELDVDEEEQEEELKARESSDEDFEVEPNIVINEYEGEAEPENADGLIDFEDIIRADVVVNFKKLDYDNLIQRTEIKSNLTKSEFKRRMRSHSSTKTTKKATKAKATSSDVKKATKKHIVEPDIESLTSTEDTNCNKPINDNLNESISVVSEVNVDKEKESNRDSVSINLDEALTPNPSTLNGTDVDFESSKNLDKDVPVESTALDVDAIQNVNNSDTNSMHDNSLGDIVIQKTETVLNEDEEDDDVIVLGELKPEIIVLDD